MILASLFCALVLLANLSAGQQEKYRSGAINTRTGLLLVSNDADNWYTLEIKGSDVRLTSTKPKVFNVDGMFMQVVTAKISKFLGEQEKRPADEKTILQAHRDWEAKYAQGSYTEKLVIESSWQKLDNGKDALLWKYKVPEGTRTNVKEQIYLTVVKGDYVLMLGGIVTDEIKEEDSLKLLITTISSLKVSDKPIDFDQLQESIRKGEQ
jgi:hypothetical protein